MTYVSLFEWNYKTAFDRIITCNNFSQYFLDLLRKFANRNYQICEGCILEIGDAKHLNPIVQSMRFNRVNPVQAVPCHDPKGKHTNKDGPFSLIRLRTRMFIAIFGRFLLVKISL